MTKDFTNEPYSVRVEKPWGYEIVITPPNAPVTGKLAFTNAGQRWSLQYHEKKTEIICLISGKAVLALENKEIKMTPFKGYLVKSNQKHRLQAKTDCLTAEFSTPEAKSKTIRLEDDYGRKDETEKDRQRLRKK